MRFSQTRELKEKNPYISPTAPPVSRQADSGAPAVLIPPKELDSKPGHKRNNHDRDPFCELPKHRTKRNKQDTPTDSAKSKIVDNPKRKKKLARPFWITTNEPENTLFPQIPDKLTKIDDNKHAPQSKRNADMLRDYKKESSKRSHRRVQEIIRCNQHQKLFFITLTFRKAIFDVDRAFTSFYAFIRRLRLFFGDQNQYILVAEKHKSSAIHLHCIITINANFVANPVISRLWKLGFVNITKIRKKNVYIAKYITKTRKDNFYTHTYRVSKDWNTNISRSWSLIQFNTTIPEFYQTLFAQCDWKAFTLNDIYPRCNVEIFDLYPKGAKR